MERERTVITPAQALLDESWQIVVIVEEVNLAGLSHTLRDVHAQSYGRDCSILAQDVAAVRSALQSQTLPVEFALPAAIEAGKFWATVFAEHSFAANRTLFLRAGVRLPVAWDARLVAVAQSQPKAAVVAPLHAQCPIAGAFSEPQLAPRLPVDAVDQWLNDYAAGREFSLPVMPAACLLLQGDYWRGEHVPGESEPCLADSEFPIELQSMGQWVVATDQLYVDDSVCQLPVLQKLLQPAVAAGFESHHPLASLRHALGELCTRGERPDSERDCLPVQLHVGHSWGGGLNRWITNYLAADTTHHHLVLRSVGDRTAFGQQIALYGSADMTVPLRTWVLAKPILSTVVSQLEYECLLAEVVSEFNVESLVVSSFIGHSLDLLRSGLPTTLVLHDFFPFCPALYACFGTPCETCDSTSLKACRLENPLYSFFDHEDHEHWLSIRSAYTGLLLAGRPLIVAPTQSVVDRYFALQPALRALNPQVIPHGLDGELISSLSQARRRKPAVTEKLKVVVLGRLTAEKGALLLKHIVPQTEDIAEFFLLGCGEQGEEFQGMESCTVVEDYPLDQLAALITKMSPDMGLLLSIVPETFSYTLSELFAMGVPVMATRLGAFSDRIVDGETGWLESPDAEKISTRLRELAVDREIVEQVGQNATGLPTQSAPDMVEHYNSVHPVHPGIPVRRFFLPRRSFQNPYLEVAQQDQTLRYIERTHGVEATYRGVLRDFLQYSALKADQTQRMPRIIRLAVSKTLSLLAKAV